MTVKETTPANAEASRRRIGRGPTPIEKARVGMLRELLSCSRMLHLNFSTYDGLRLKGLSRGELNRTVDLMVEAGEATAEPSQYGIVVRRVEKRFQ